MFKVDLEKLSGLVALARVGACLLSECMHVSVESWGLLGVMVSSWEAISTYLLNVVEQKYQPQQLLSLPCSVHTVCTPPASPTSH